MNDNNNVNEGPRVYTEEEVFRLFQRFKNEEKLAEHVVFTPLNTYYSYEITQILYKK